MEELLTRRTANYTDISGSSKVLTLTKELSLIGVVTTEDEVVISVTRCNDENKIIIEKSNHNSY